MDNNELILTGLIKSLKKLDSLDYVSSVYKMDNSLVVVKNNGDKFNFDMIKGEKGERGTSYDLDVARQSMNELIDAYKKESLEEVKAILEISNNDN